MSFFEDAFRALLFEKSPASRKYLLALVERQTAIVRAMCLLPGSYTYDQVDEALYRARMDPDTLYMALAEGRKDIILDFSLALHGGVIDEPA